MQPEFTQGEVPDYYRYRAKVSELSTKENVEPKDVHDLLAIKESVLRINPTHAPKDLAFLRVVRDWWDEGNRVPTLHYLFLEALGEDVIDQKTYERRAAFWLKCAESLLSEPLCVNEQDYENVFEIIRERMRDKDPELWDTIVAAVKFNRLAMCEEADGTMLKALHEDYRNFRTELFGPTVNPNNR